MAVMLIYKLLQDFFFAMRMIFDNLTMGCQIASSQRQGNILNYIVWVYVFNLLFGAIYLSYISLLDLFKY